MWLWWLVALAVVVAAVLWLLWWPGWQRQRIMQQPFPAAWLVILQANLPYFSRLDQDQQRRLQQLLLWFLHSKTFIGCGGLQVSDEMRVTIAGEACLLILHRTGHDYDQLRYIYLYPSAYQAPSRDVDAAGVVSDKLQARLGESWEDGKLVLSWDDVVRGSSDFSDGHNVVLHEFAHQLDQATGSSNGAPILRNPASYRRWAGVLSAEFEHLQQQARHGQHTVLSHYGATNPAEFFAVATEHFFEQPAAMQQQHPRLFTELRDYYGLDPQRLH